MNSEQPQSQTPPQPPQNGWGPTPSHSQTPLAPSAFTTPAAPSQPLGESYLNEIAVTEPVKVHRFAVIGLIGGILVMLLVGLIILMNSGGPSLSTQAKSINGRVNTLKTLASTQQKHLQDNNISEANVTLSSVLTSLSSSLGETMKARKITLSSAVTTTEKASATTLTKKLEDSYQRGTLDRTYAPQMAYGLSILRSKIVAMRNSNSSSSIKTFANDAIKNLDAIITTFKNYTSTN